MNFTEKILRSFKMVLPLRRIRQYAFVFLILLALLLCTTVFRWYWNGSDPHYETDLTDPDIPRYYSAGNALTLAWEELEEVLYRPLGFTIRRTGDPLPTLQRILHPSCSNVSVMYNINHERNISFLSLALLPCAPFRSASGLRIQIGNQRARTAKNLKLHRDATVTWLDLLICFTTWVALKGWNKEYFLQFMSSVHAKHAEGWSSTWFGRLVALVTRQRRRYLGRIGFAAHKVELRELIPVSYRESLWFSPR